MSTVRVVVIDDSAFSRRTITKMLEGIKDIEVVGFATNGEEGIQKVAALKPDHDARAPRPPAPGDPGRHFPFPAVGLELRHFHGGKVRVVVAGIDVVDA